jgi:phosphoesterase RecJ-like protein
MSELAKYTKELSDLFMSSDNILLICHINPDGDAIGSQLALYHYLKSKGRKVTMISPNKLQEFLKWMDGADNIRIFTGERKECIKFIEEASLIVLLDFSQQNRLGEVEQYVVRSASKKVIIDHHLEPQDFADLIISDTSKCSTTELIYEVIKDIEGKPFKHIKFSEAIYVGIVTDTGNFEHGSYTGRTLHIVADLLETGIERERIHNLIYNNYSESRMRLLGLALNKRLTVIPEMNTAYIYLTQQDLNEYNHVMGDTEGFVNMPLSIKGIDFSVLFIEKAGFIKLSFRSKGNFPVNEFASKYFSGGGHLNASGGEYNDTLENTIAYFLKVLKETRVSTY